MNILPREIEATLLRIAGLDEEINGKRAALKRLESRATLELTGAKDDKGKLVLTNDKQREAAIAEYLECNEEFLKLYREVKAAEAERAGVVAGLERLRIEVKFELLALEGRNLADGLRLADAIWHARQGADAFSPEKVRRAVSGITGPPAPEFFRGELRVINDREAGAELDVDIPF
jgi:hypothetical protein